MASTVSLVPIKTASQFTTWMAQIPVNLSLSTVDMQCIAECYRGTYSFDTGLTFSALNIISTATQNVIVRAAPGHEHKGVPGAGVLFTFTSVGSTGHCFKMSTPFMVAEDLELTWSGGTNTLAQIRLARIDSTGTDAYFNRMLVHDLQHSSLATSSCVGISCQNGSCYNSAVWNIGQPIQSITNTRGISCAASEAGRITRIYNNSIFSCYDGLLQGTVNNSTSTIEMKNNLLVAGAGSAASISIGMRIQVLAGNALCQGNASFDSSADTFGDTSFLTLIPNTWQAHYPAEPSTTAGLPLISTDTSAISGGAFLSDGTWRTDITGYDRYAAAGRVDRGAYQFTTAPHAPTQGGIASPRHRTRR